MPSGLNALLGSPVKDCTDFTSSSRAISDATSPSSDRISLLLDDDKYDFSCSRASVDDVAREIPNPSRSAKET